MKRTYVPGLGSEVKGVSDVVMAELLAVDVVHRAAEEDLACELVGDGSELMSVPGSIHARAAEVNQQTVTLKARHRPHEIDSHGRDQQLSRAIGLCSQVQEAMVVNLSVDQLALGHSHRRWRQPAELHEPIDEAGLLLDLKGGSIAVSERERASWYEALTVLITSRWRKSGADAVDADFSTPCDSSPREIPPD